MIFSAILVFVFIPTILLAQTDVVPPIPIPAENPAIHYIPPGRNDTLDRPPQVVLEAFIEVLCKDSRAAFPELKQVAAYYSSSQFALHFNQMPLPYHRNGFLATQGLYLIQDELPDMIFEYMEAALNLSEVLSTAETENKTEIEVIEILADAAVDSTGIDRDLFIDNVNNYASPAVRAWKYAVRRGTAGTPWFFVNGVDLGLNPIIKLTYEDWREILDPLFAENN